MKLVGVVNCWAIAPRFWLKHLQMCDYKHHINEPYTNDQVSIGLLGFIVFIELRKESC